MQTTRTTQPRSASHQHSGFTLLELLIVIAVIAILTALILPALQNVRTGADIAAAQTDMRKLETGLTKFQTRYGTLPPSSLSIPAMGGTWSTEDMAAVRAIWPNFDFTTRGGLDSASPVPGALHLNGAECLVFFLGGVQSGTVDAPVLGGFSADPETPWTSSEKAERQMDFELARIVDVDGDSLFEYVDTIPDQTTPILFLSSRGKRYNTSEDSGTDDDYDVYADGDARNMTSCYFEADGTTPIRSDSYQLISPGGDHLYGTGGAFHDGVDLSGRTEERDNIANFSDGVFE